MPLRAGVDSPSNSDLRGGKEAVLTFNAVLATKDGLKIFQKFLGKLR